MASGSSKKRVEADRIGKGGRLESRLSEGTRIVPSTFAERPEWAVVSLWPPVGGAGNRGRGG